MATLAITPAPATPLKEKTRSQSRENMVKFLATNLSYSALMSMPWEDTFAIMYPSEIPVDRGAMPPSVVETKEWILGERWSRLPGWGARREADFPLRLLDIEKAGWKPIVMPNGKYRIEVSTRFDGKGSWWCNYVDGGRQFEMVPDWIWSVRLVGF
jgi:hypothetical protein